MRNAFWLCFCFLLSRLLSANAAAAPDKPSPQKPLFNLKFDRQKAVKFTAAGATAAALTAG